MKNNPYKRIFSLVGVGLGKIQLEIPANYTVGQQYGQGAARKIPACRYAAF